jgi:hypothetical protein
MKQIFRSSKFFKVGIIGINGDVDGAVDAGGVAFHAFFDAGTKKA